MLNVDITIVGAGVIGLAIAYQISNPEKNIVILEKESKPGEGISSRNSEVIHAGIYYPYGSLKAKLCVQGNQMLYTFCKKHEVPFKQIGKVIVAMNNNEEQSIKELYITGSKNGAPGLQMLSRFELKAIEPHVEGLCALLSPYTGIIDSHRLIRQLEALSISQGTTILYKTKLVSLNKNSDGFLCTVEGPDTSSYSFSSRTVINAAGLESDRVAEFAGISIADAEYKIYPVKGEYFRVSSKKQHLINGLVYPSPEKSLTGLGIHATKDLAGSLRLGPNAFYVDEINYNVNTSHAKDFYEGTKDFLPFLKMEDIQADMAGIRPKIQKPGGQIKDFVISHEYNRDLYGLINLIGIESPGLTSSLAIGKMVNEMLREACLL